MERHKWICTICHRVYSANQIRCCGEGESFDPVKHRDYIIGKSNAWINVWERWKDDPLLQDSILDLAKDGCYGSSSALNEFIERLKNEAAD